MPNNLEIILTLNDQATRGLSKVKKDLVGFANNFKANFLKISASITAAIFAIQKAFDLAKLGARAKQQEQAFRNLAVSVGASADLIIRDLKRLSGETLSTTQVIQAASRALVLGIGPEQLPKLMEISRAAARAFGADVNFMFDSITLGIGRQSRMILDNLGIIVRAESVYKEYAAELGVSVKQLTDFQKRQAFANAVLVAGEDILRKVNVQQKTQFENLSSLSAFWQDFKEQAGQAILEIIRIFSIFVNTLRSGFATIVEASGRATSAIVNGLINMNNKLIEVTERIPFLNRAYRDLGGRLEELKIKTEATTQEFTSLKDEFAAAAVEISRIVDSEASPALSRLKDSVEKVKTEISETSKKAKEIGNNLSAAVSGPLSDLITGAETGKEAFASMGKNILKVFADLIAQTIVAATLGAAIQKTATAFAVAQAAILAIAWEPAAVFAATATAGGAAVAGAAAIGASFGLASALSAAKTTVAAAGVASLAEGGIVPATPGGRIVRVAEAGQDEAIIPLDRDGGGLTSGINITVNNPSLSSNQNIREVAELLGFETDRAIRTARGF